MALLIIGLAGFLVYSYFTGAFLSDEEREFKRIESALDQEISEYARYQRTASLSGLADENSLDKAKRAVLRIKQSLAEFKETTAGPALEEKIGALEERISKFLSLE